MKAKHITLRVDETDYSLLHAFAKAQGLTVSNVLRYVIEDIAGRMTKAVPCTSVLVDDIEAASRAVDERVTRGEPSPAPAVVPIERPKPPSKPPLVQHPRARPASPMPPTEQPNRKVIRGTPSKKDEREDADY